MRYILFINSNNSKHKPFLFLFLSSNNCLLYKNINNKNFLSFNKVNNYSTKRDKINNIQVAIMDRFNVIKQFLLNQSSNNTNTTQIKQSPTQLQQQQDFKKTMNSSQKVSPEQQLQQQQQQQQERQEMSPSSFLRKRFFSSKNFLQQQTSFEKIEASVYDQLKFHLKELRDHFQLVIETKNTTTITLSHLLNKYSDAYLTHLQVCLQLNEKIMKNASKYDYDSEHQRNGYRSLSKMLEKCCQQTLTVVRELSTQKTNFLFEMKHKITSSYVKEFETWLKLIEKLAIVLDIASKMQDMTENKETLFVHGDELDEKVEQDLFMIASQDQDAFFGRTCAFQFCDSLKLPLTGCAVALASYNDGYSAFQDNAIGQTAKSLLSGTKYLINPELRAQKIGDIIKNADVEFCKAFWQLTETSIVHMGTNIITPNIPVNIVKTLDLNTLEIERVDCQNDEEKFVKVQPPLGLSAASKLNIRILSAEIRDGMEKLDPTLAEVSPLNGPKQILAKSPHLILHAHGGGFIAHSSKSHEVYLRPWCKDLHVPIVSIDYSLAPEHPFPKASEECFYAYVWCLLNKDLLGWTGEKIICVGDSAGGVLVTNIVQRAIAYGIRIPDALVPIYAPFLLSYSLSPSRLMSIMDPLLNLGVLWRCLAAYCGIEFKLFENKTPEIQNQSKSPSPDPAVAEVKEQQKEPLLIDIDDGTDNTVNKTEEVTTKFEIDENSSAEETKKRNDKLLKLRKVIGDSVYLIELLRNHSLPKNPYMSPLLSDDEILKKMPKTFLIACADPFLDDSIEMAKVFRTKNVDHELIIIDNGIPHGFLNMRNLCDETRFAAQQVQNVLSSIINNTSPSTLPQQQQPN